MNKSNLKWCFDKTHGNRKFLIGIVLIIVIVSFCNIMNSYSLKLLLDIASGNSETPIFLGMCLPILVAFIAAMAKGIQYIWGQKMVLYISKNLKIEMLIHSEKMKWTSLTKYQSGDILNRMIQDVPEVAHVFPTTIANIFVGFFSCLFALIYGFMLSWKITIVALIVSPLVIIFSKYLIPKMAHYSKEEKEEDSKLVSYTQEQINDVVNIKMFENYITSKEKYEGLYKKFFEKSMKKVSIESVLWNGSGFVGFLGFAVSVAFGSFLCARGEVTLGTVVGYAQLLNYVIWPFSEAPEALSKIKKSMVSALRVRTILNESAEDIELKGAIDYDESSNWNLVFEEVSFGYSKEKTIINGLNAQFHSGDMVGVIGESGCGKSTLIKLIMSLYEPESGRIRLISGKKAYSGLEIRKLISYVPQEHTLFYGSILENITLGNKKYNKEQVIEAAKKAGIHDVIIKMERGYDTCLGENGENISFGQSQRIAIARALLKDAPILLFDEPTASLDKETEAYIMEIVRNQCKRNKICIVISHTLTETENYSNVIRFSDGKIAVIYNQSL